MNRLHDYAIQIITALASVYALLFWNITEPNVCQIILAVMSIIEITLFMIANCTEGVN